MVQVSNVKRQSVKVHIETDDLTPLMHRLINVDSPLTVNRHVVYHGVVRQMMKEWFG